MKIEFLRHIFEKYSNIKFRENRSSGRWVVPCGRTDGHKDWYDEANRRNFSNAPNKDIRKMLSDDSNDDKYD